MKKSYAYKPSLSNSLKGILFFGVCTIYLALEATMNDCGLLINGIISLSPSNTTAFYWLSSGVSFLLAIICIYFLILCLTSTRQIILNEKQIIVPENPFKNSNVVIPYRAILKLQSNVLRKQRMLVITHVGGSLTIPDSLLPDKMSSDELYIILSKKVRESRMSQEAAKNH